MSELEPNTGPSLLGRRALLQGASLGLAGAALPRIGGAEDAVAAHHGSLSEPSWDPRGPSWDPSTNVWMSFILTHTFSKFHFEGGQYSARATGHSFTLPTWKTQIHPAAPSGGCFNHGLISLLMIGYC